MAFNYYTIDSIKNIDKDNIPKRFINYYNGLSDEMKAEIAEVRPDLVVAMGGTIDNATQEVAASTDTDSLNAEELLVDDEDEEIDDPIIDIWESMPANAWHQYVVRSDVLVCKMMPQHNRICRIHRVQMQEKNLRLDNGKYGIIGYFCPECFDFYLEDPKLERLIPQIEKRNIQTVIQPLDITMQDWKENGAPVEVTTDDIIYIPDTWIEDQMYCPLHPDEVLLEDNYRKTYVNRHVDFEACYCKQCKKIIMRNSKAQQLEEDCAEIGIPAITFKPLRKEKVYKSTVKQKVTPHYFVVNGSIQNYSFSSDADIEWDVLDEDDVMVVSYSRACMEEDHETEDRLGLLRVREKKAGIKYYLVYLGYCEQCEQYYIEQEDYEIIYTKGRPAVTIIDEVEADHMITSGSVFDSERNHLQMLEKEFTDRITSIENLPDYVGEFATVSGANNDDAIGQLKSEKEHCRPYYEEMAQIRSYQDNPYEHRADIIFDGQTEVYYLGVNDVYVNGVRKVISNRSNLGRALVNYRNLEVTKDGKIYNIKRRRNFDIVRANLFGYMEQSDEDAVFQKGITDQFLINVLNMRKRQHQLIDIIATIQENQNVIVDRPLNENLIVQGCAGSGKTMVLLHRLSILKYNNPNYDFSRVAILTPNDHFNTHISGLAGSLQIGYVNRLSVEEYYRKLLLEYDDSFKLTVKISDEMNVPQVYVDYVYSDEFKQLMLGAYQRRIQELQDYYAQVAELSLKVGREAVVSAGYPVYEMLLPLLDELHAIAGVAEKQESTFRNTVDSYNAVKQRYNFVKGKVDESESVLRQVITSQCELAKEKTLGTILEREEKIAELNQSIETNQQEYDRVNGAIFVLNKNQKLGTIKGQITRAENQKTELNKEIALLTSIMEKDTTDMSEVEVQEYLSSLILYVEGISDIKRFISRQSKILEEYKEEWDTIPERLRKAEQEAERAMAQRISPEIIEEVSTLEKTLKEITAKTIFNDVYAIASQKADAILKAATGKSYLGSIRGTHRYDLYLQLLFAQRYFGKAVGNNTLICIDEGQDLAVNEYRLIKSVNRLLPVFNIFGDTHQLLKYGRGISDWNQLADVIAGTTRFDLNENYRNTNQITQFCNKTFNMTVALTGVDGHKVKEFTRRKLENALSELKLGEERVALILPRAVKKKDSYLDKDQLPYRIREALGEEIGNGKISLMYVDEVKGVEFDRVYVVPNSMTDNERYIAYTRALSDLIIVMDESLDPKEEEKVPETKPKQTKKAKKPVETSSNVKVGKVRKKKKNADGTTTGSSRKKKATTSPTAESVAQAAVKPESDKDSENQKKPVVETPSEQQIKSEEIPAEAPVEDEQEMSMDTFPLQSLKRIRDDFTDEHIAFLNNNGISTIGQFRALTTKQINAFPGGGMGDQLMKWGILQVKDDLEELYSRI